MRKRTQQSQYVTSRLAEIIRKRAFEKHDSAKVISLATDPGQARIPIWKRVLDVTAVLLSTPVTLLVALPLALYIKLVSPGPVFFTQERIGLGRRKFTLLKFRSMHCGASTSVHEKHLERLMDGEKPMQKMDGSDSRLIFLGRWIRASGLDELPQLLNVLKGEMSLVGPRPCTVFEFERYENWQKERFNAMPGLTGLWQVCGKNRTTFKQMIELDIAYSREQSIWLDFSIIVRTLPALIVQVVSARRNSADVNNEGIGAELAASTQTKKYKVITDHEEPSESRGSRVRLLGT